MSSPLPPAQGATPLQPLPTHQTPPPIDYYAADRGSSFQVQQKPVEQPPPIDYYVADRSRPYIMAAPPHGGHQPPPYQGQWQPAPQGTPIACLGPHTAPVSCPNCRQSGVTSVEYSSGGFTHALGALFCFVTCLGCIPYFFSGLKDATHKCANCGVPLATYHRSGRTEPHIQG